MAPPKVPDHPAKYSDAVLKVFKEVLMDEYERRNFRTIMRPLYVLDPLAGVGKIHELLSGAIRTYSVELEPEWVEHQSHYSQVGDCLDLDFPDGIFDAICVSPPYGNRLADNYAGDGHSKRFTYRTSLGRPLTDGSGAGMQWGSKYRAWAMDAVTEMSRVLRPGGLFVLNISDHIRGGEVMPVTDWWITALEMLGHMKQERVIPVDTPRMGFGANAKIRVDNEWVAVLRKRMSPLEPR